MVQNTCAAVSRVLFEFSRAICRRGKLVFDDQVMQDNLTGSAQTISPVAVSLQTFCTPGDSIPRGVSPVCAGRLTTVSVPSPIGSSGTLGSVVFRAISTMGSRVFS